MTFRRWRDILKWASMRRTCLALSKQSNVISRICLCVKSVDVSSLYHHNIYFIHFFEWTNLFLLLQQQKMHNNLSEPFFSEFYWTFWLWTDTKINTFDQMHSSSKSGTSRKSQILTNQSCFGPFFFQKSSKWFIVKMGFIAKVPTSKVNLIYLVNAWKRKKGMYLSLD